LTVPFRTNPWNKERGGGQELITAHYRIYTTVKYYDLLSVLPGFMEAAHRNYMAILELSGPGGDQRGDRKMPMYMLATRAEWADLTDRRFRRFSPSYVIENGGYTYQGITVCWDIGRMATLAVASHEGMHQFLHYTLRSRLPLWAEEGLATTAEGFILGRQTVRFLPDNNTIRKSDLRKAITGDYWLPLEKLLTANTMSIARGGTVKEAVGYYGQVYALIHMLRHDERYHGNWRRMLEDARQGRFREVLPRREASLSGMRYHRAVSLALFKHYITSDLREFERDYYEYARKLVRLPPSPME
jgi:hypothetical protein